jgi:single-strand DNA-binding protein
MAKSLNKVMLIGHLGKDPELKYTTSGSAIATFSIATNESWKDQEGNLQERTEWHNIVAWKRLAEISHEYLKKGKKVYIEGRIQTRSYDDKNTGAKKYITEIVANDLIMLDGGSGAGGGASRAPSSHEAPSQQGGGGEAAPGSGGQVNDDLPF